MQSFLKNIVEFIDVLRTAGMRVSNSESIDSINALNHTMKFVTCWIAVPLINLIGQFPGFE